MTDSLAPDSQINYQGLARQIDSASGASAYSTIVNAPFEQKMGMAFLFLGFVCLYIVDEETQGVQLKAASGTEEYKLAVEHFNFNPDDYNLDFKKHKKNTIVQAIVSGKPQATDDWVTLNRGQTPDETVRLNQANSGIAYTIIYPLLAPLRGAVMYNYYQYEADIGREQWAFMERFTELVSKHLAAQKK